MLWNGPVLELHTRAVARLGPDILADPPDLDRMLAKLRRGQQAREVGDALLDQRLVAGIGNKWKAEALWHARLSPWRRLAEATDAELRAVLEAAATMMRRSLDGVRGRNGVYRRAGRPCPRCGAAIRSRGQGDANRIPTGAPGVRRDPPLQLERSMVVRAPHLHDALRAFCLAAFAELGPEAEQAGELPFIVEEHASGFYEYRPLVRDHVQARAFWLAKLADARIAIDELHREPAAAIFARAHVGPESSERRALFRAILLPLLVRTAEACGGFDWEDGAFRRIYAELERSLYGTTRVYTAVAPLVGLSVGAPVELGRGICVHPSSPDELSVRWPESRDLLPARFGLEPERTCVLELERELPGDEDTPPDAPSELADAVTALRLATAAPAAAGPVVLERLDWHPFGIRPVLGIAATEPGGEPTRLDPWRGGLAGELLDRLGQVEGDTELAEAIERWELSLFEDEPLRSERLRESVAALLGGVDGLWAAAMRASVLLGETNRERSGLIERLRALARGERAEPEATDDLRRAIVETLLHEDRERLLSGLDDALLGLRPRPAGYYSARAVAS